MPQAAGRNQVSIPFASGRQRCLDPLSVDALICASFNPLRIGEAALPNVTLAENRLPESVSIPFASGRQRCPYSLNDRTVIRAGYGFQSPSHRGGSAADVIRPNRIVTQDFPFQSPSHRGGSAASSTCEELPEILATRGGSAAQAPLTDDIIRPNVSIPFASGRQRCRWLYDIREKK